MKSCITLSTSDIRSAKQRDVPSDTLISQLVPSIFDASLYLAFCSLRMFSSAIVFFDTSGYPHERQTQVQREKGRQVNIHPTGPVCCFDFVHSQKEGARTVSYGMQHMRSIRTFDWRCYKRLKVSTHFVSKPVSTFDYI